MPEEHYIANVLAKENARKAVLKEIRDYDLTYPNYEEVAHIVDIIVDSIWKDIVEYFSQK